MNLRHLQGHVGQLCDRLIARGIDTDSVDALMASGINTDQVAGGNTQA
jgi:hypothetical protein